MQEIDLRIMCIGMEYVVRHSFHEMEIGNLFQHLPMLIPSQRKRGERLRCHPRLAIQTGRRGGRLDRLKVQRTDVIGHGRLPKLAHRHIGILEELHNIRREYIARSGLVGDGKSLLLRQGSHPSKELIDKQIVDGLPPIE